MLGTIQPCNKKQMVKLQPRKSSCCSSWREEEHQLSLMITHRQTSSSIPRQQEPRSEMEQRTLSHPHSAVTPKTVNRFLTMEQGSHAPGDTNQFAPRPARRLPWHRGPPSHHARAATWAASPTVLPNGDIGVGTISATHPGILQTQLLCRVVTCSLWSTFQSLLQDLVPSPSLSSSLPRAVQEGVTPCNANGQRRLSGLGTLATLFSGMPPSAPLGAGGTVSWT